MKRNLFTISAIILCSLISVATADAQVRRGGSDRHNSHSTIRSGRNGSGNYNIRPGNNKKPQNPGNNKFRPGQTQPRPSHNVRHGGNRPMNPYYGHRPGPNRPGRPAYSYRPGPNRPVYMRPPARPGRPPIRPWTRPVPPPHWRPSYTGSLLGNILGLTFGIAINSALDNLYYSGYCIDGYMNNQVYLTGVSQFNTYWPDATLYFGNNGLVRSQFFNPTYVYDTNRFYSVYSTLCGLYGVPAINNTVGSSLSATWFGRNGDYITLQYSPMVSGNYNYFTVLTIGN